MHSALPPAVPTPELLLSAYCQGIFPMGRGRSDPAVDWYQPDPRAILPLEEFRCPRSLRQEMRKGCFEIHVDRDFEAVMRGCSLPRITQEETWINETLVAAYVNLHRLGCAHSVEAWTGGRLVGGLYGVALGGVFFGESMFHLPEAGGTGASKICLVHLVEGLRAGGYVLLDVQMTTPHLQRFGAVDLPLAGYLERLEAALQVAADWRRGFGGPGRIA